MFSLCLAYNHAQPFISLRWEYIFISYMPYYKDQILKCVYEFKNEDISRGKNLKNTGLDARHT